MDYYQIYGIDEQTWRLEDCFKGYMYLLEGEKRAVLIDTGFGLPGLDALVKQLTDKPVTVINTHGHGDHCGGNYQFSDCRMMACDREIAEEHLSKPFRREIMTSLAEEFALPVSGLVIGELAEIKNRGTFGRLNDHETFDLGSRTLEVIAVPGHTPGSICVLDRERNNLFSADTVCDQGVLLFFDHSMPVSVFSESIRHLKLRQNEYERMWPGHHSCPLQKDYLERYERCALDIMANSEAGERVETNLGSGRIYVQMGITIAYNDEKI